MSEVCLPPSPLPQTTKPFSYLMNLSDENSVILSWFCFLFILHLSKISSMSMHVCDLCCKSLVVELLQGTLNLVETEQIFLSCINNSLQDTSYFSSHTTLNSTTGVPKFFVQTFVKIFSVLDLVFMFSKLRYHYEMKNWLELNILTAMRALFRCIPSLRLQYTEHNLLKYFLHDSTMWSLHLCAFFNFDLTSNFVSVLIFIRIEVYLCSILQFQLLIA